MMQLLEGCILLLQLLSLLDEGNELGWLTCLLEEWMSKQSVCVWTSFYLDIDAVIEEIVEVGRPASLFLEGWDTLCGDEEEMQSRVV